MYWSSRSLLQTGATSSQSLVRQANIGIDVVDLLNRTIWPCNRRAWNTSRHVLKRLHVGLAMAGGVVGHVIVGGTCTHGMHSTPLPTAQVWMSLVPYIVRRSAFGRWSWGTGRS